MPMNASHNMDIPDAQSRIAIVGIAAELPSGYYANNNLDQESFFQFLLDKGQSYERIPADRFNIDAWKGNGIGTIHVDKGAFLKDIDMFDNVEFGISSRDARALAPATKKLLETSFLALLDSGIDYRSRNIGCYTSATSFDITNVSEPDEFEARGSFAGYPSMVSNRISIHLDLLGPSVPTDTACSSSLTSLHLAVQAIANGDCEAAVVGGCQLNHRFIDWVTYSRGSILSKDGKCKPFDVSADGFARAEGCVAIVIKPLKDAIKNSDHIYATILGTAINSVGGGAPPGAPVAEAQREAMVQAFKRAGRSPRDVDYIELHATGTAKGDPTEANWVGKEFSRDRPLLIGSVKGNIGHTEITAFLASLSKVLSILQHNVIPPNVNLEIPNPAIKWKEYDLHAPLEPTELPCPNGVRPLIAMAGSGIGGSNGHVVLEGTPRNRSSFKAKTDGDCMRTILLISGGLSPRTTVSISDSVRAAVEKHAEELDLASLSIVLGRRSRQMSWRSYAILEPGSNPVFSTPQLVPRTPNPIVFVFSGQGPQHKDMGRQLFSTFPVFRDSVLEMDTVFQRITGRSIIHHWGLFDGDFPSSFADIWPIAVTLPSIAIFQIALSDLLASLGVKPNIVCGHSAGETAVLYASGAASKAMSVELAIIRGDCFSPLEKLGGAMAAVSCGKEQAESLLAQYHIQASSGVVEVACYNSPSAVAIAGDETAVDDVLKIAKDQGIACTKLRTHVPIHSSLMETCRDEYLTRLQDLFDRYPGPMIPKIPTYSTLTGKLVSESYDANYFWHNTRSQVQFTQAMDNMTAGQTKNFTFIEISPHPVLLPYVTSMASAISTVLPVVRRPKSGKLSSEHRDVLEFCGKFIATGHNGIDFLALNNRKSYEPKIPIPTYPFLKKRFPLYPDTPWITKQLSPRAGPLNHPYLKLNKETHPTLAEHVIRSEPIMPAAGFLEMAFEFGATCLMNVKMRSILSLSSELPIKVSVGLQGSYWSVKSFGTSAEPKTTERLHADGYLSFEEPKPAEKIDLQAIRKRSQLYTSSDFYPSLSYFSSYGPRLQRVTNVDYNFSEALVSIQGLDESLREDGNYVLHPAILDAAIQITAYRPFHGDTDPNSYYLPAGVKAVVLHKPTRVEYFPAHIYAYVQVKCWTPSSMLYDVSLVDDSGDLLCSLRGFEVERHHFNPPVTVSRPLDIVMQKIKPPKYTSSPQFPKIPVDRSELYRYLDLLVSDHAKTNLANTSHCPVKTLSNGNNLKSLFELRDKWPDFFREMDHNNSQDRYMRDWEGPHFDRALLNSNQGLYDTVKLFAGDGSRRVLRIFIGNGAQYVLSYLETIQHEFPSLFYDVVSASQNLNQKNFSLPNIRVVHSFDGGELTAMNYSFDIAVALNLEPSDLSYKDRFIKYNKLLIPGGILIVTERSSSAWECNLPGHQWYDALFGRPDLDDQCDVNIYACGIAKANYSVICAKYTSEEDPFHFLIVAQKSYDYEIHDPSILSLDAYTFHYQIGNERELQTALAKLPEGKDLDIRLIVTAGLDSGSCKGLSRALRREYPAWTIRVFIFHSSIPNIKRHAFLRDLPEVLDSELEIEVTSDLLITVPRIVPLPNLGYARTSTTVTPTLLPNELLLRVLSTSSQGTISSIQATVINSGSTSLPCDAIIIGLTPGNPVPGDYISSDVDSVFPINRDIDQYEPSSVLHFLPGAVVAVLGPGLSLFRRPERLKTLQILVTNCDAEIGKSITLLYSAIGIPHTSVSTDISLLELSDMDSFDLILCGYDNQSYIQVLRRLLRPQTGRLYLWNDQASGFITSLSLDPCSVGEAICEVIAAMKSSGESFPVITYPTTPVIPRPSATPSCPLALRSDRTYVILGGLGNIGIHIALFLYQRGARYILLTSRSGENGVKNSKNIILRRMLAYLKRLPDLTLRLEAVDAVSYEDMKALMSLSHPKIAGCFILTANIRDKTFHNLSAENFAAAFSSKSGVLEVLKSTVDISTLDFVVAFSSVSGTFGFGGQTNYGAANTALEESMLAVPNGFSFICPGILDTSLVLAAGVDPHDPRLRHYIRWSITAEDMIRWLEHALILTQSGHKFSRYIPDLDWSALDQSLGMPRLGQHLVLEQKDEDVNWSNDDETLTSVVRDVLSIASEDFSPEVPLTSYGIDSLSASRLSFSLRPVVEVTQMQLLADMSVDDIRRRLEQSDTAVPDLSPAEPSIASMEKHNVNPMLTMLEKYMSDIDVWKRDGPPEDPACFPSGEAVLLTGTTGSLGCNILFHLLQNKNISKVYAFNRASPNDQTLCTRQESAFKRHGLPIWLLKSSKLVMIEATLHDEDFGISKEIMKELRSSVTHIIHNAWRIDFLKPLSDFEELVLGTKQLMKFALSSRLRDAPSMSFISSIAVSPRLDNSMESAPEEPLESGLLALEAGYLQSKWVGERLCQIVAERTSMRTNVIRVGLLTGGLNGFWDPSHWVPSLIQSTSAVGCLPDGDAIISWIPVHSAAAAIVDMRFTMNETLHVIHPQPTSWSSIMELLATSLNVPLVPYHEWYARLEATARHSSLHSSQGSQKSVSALKLLDFYSSGVAHSRSKLVTESLGLLPRVAADKGLRASQTLREEQLQALGADDARRWMECWRNSGFIPLK